MAKGRKPERIVYPNILRLLEIRDMSIADFARRLGMGEQKLRHKLHGRRRIYIEELIKMKAVLQAWGMPLEGLYEREEANAIS